MKQELQCGILRISRKVVHEQHMRYLYHNLINVIKILKFNYIVEHGSFILSKYEKDESA